MVFLSPHIRDQKVSYRSRRASGLTTLPKRVLTSLAGVVWHSASLLTGKSLRELRCSPYIRCPLLWLYGTAQPRVGMSLLDV